ncbi:DUF305 domain-containing protein [Nocardia jinanensis]|uniref:DUF305 domain-containing protein n=1 Tax=Nocardia jinanensis TaxID=382504 RepID=A0A917VL12_9NOCA|nr:DUF305 domain-containing protein [Nocardia jinanensis]GGK96013.1 DUF305 domain-containing protein [Nocardia jinanensis]
MNRLRNGFAVLVAAGSLLVLGAAVRPLFVDDPAAPEILSATEIGFVQDMAAHHHQALVMVQRLDPGAGPAVQGLARQIEDTQLAEIGTLLGWLRLAGAPVAGSEPMSWMPGQTHDHHAAPDPSAAAMPGMATRTELDTLSAARGRDAAVQFLRLMQRHHEGGIAMARVADALLTEGVVKQVAREMITEQTQESGLMALLLAQLEASPPG